VAFPGVIWRVARRRWVRRVLIWMVMRLVRLFGWRRALRLVFGERGRWRLAALGVWRATVWLLRLGRSAKALLGWVSSHVPRSLAGQTLRVPLVIGSWRLLGADAHRPGKLRADLPRRLAHRRDNLRRSILVAVGVDPAWRPKRKGRGSVIGSESPPLLGDKSSR
jgi:hypothetical protein